MNQVILAVAGSRNGIRSYCVTASNRIYRFCFQVGNSEVLISTANRQVGDMQQVLPDS